jgi:GT2 family glycosyltransferase
MNGQPPSREHGRPPGADIAVSVVVPHYQDLANLDICLDLLARQTLPADRFEIIVVDNLSPAGFAKIQEIVAGRALLLENPRKGAGPTRNAGVARARGAALAFLDSDCRPAPDWLERGLAALETASVIGGRVDVLVTDPAAMSATEAFEMVFAFNNEGYVRDKGFSVSANLFVRRDVWEVVGGFRDGISEDVDWCWRARDAGFPVAYAPEARVGHPARRDWSELVRKWRRLTREGYALHREKAGSLPSWLLRSWAVPLSALAHLPRVMRSPKLSRPVDRMRAAGILLAIRAYRFVDAHRVPFEKPEGPA